MPLHIALRCDATPETGTGHVVRCLALGDELTARGAEVTLIGEITDVAWLTEQVALRGLPVIAAPADPDDLARLAQTLHLDAVVLDGYHLDPRCGTALLARGLTVLALLDATYGGAQEADLYLDHNLGARPDSGRNGAVQLLGLRYALFRDEVLRHRRDAAAGPESTPRVLAVFGGTDPYAAAPVVVALLISTGRPVHVVAVAASPELAQALDELPTGPGQTIEVVSPRPQLAALAATCDLAVTAAGSSVWEFLYMGLPAALVCVVDNQTVGYDVVASEGVAEPLGHLADLRDDPRAREAAVAMLARLLDDPDRRAALSQAGTTIVDGRGRSRVVDALISAIDARR